MFSENPRFAVLVMVGFSPENKTFEHLHRKLDERAKEFPFPWIMIFEL